MLKVPRGHAYEAGTSEKKNRGRGEWRPGEAATINIKQNVGKANIVIKNNNNRRPSGEYGKERNGNGNGGTEGSGGDRRVRPTPGDGAERRILRLREYCRSLSLLSSFDPCRHPRPDNRPSHSRHRLATRINTSIRSEFSSGIYETRSARTNSNNR